MSRNHRLDWIRVETNFEEHPQAIAAGFMGCTVYQFLCRVAGAFGMTDGQIKALYLSDAWLLRRSNGASLDFIRAGIADACRAGLLIRDGDELIIPDFSRFIGLDTTRKQEYRNERKQETKPECPGTVPGLSANVPHPTLPNPTLRDVPNEPEQATPLPPPGGTPAPAKPGRARPSSNHRINLNVETWRFEGITEADKEAFRALAPACDVDEQIAKCEAECRLNEHYRKKLDWSRALGNWMKIAQRKAEGRSFATSGKPNLFPRYGEPG